MTIRKTNSGWRVLSNNSSYFVTRDSERKSLVCNCSDYTRNSNCFHVESVLDFEEQRLLVKQRKKDSSEQDWRLYTQAQILEGSLFHELLYELVQCIDEPEQERGRPKLSLRELIYCSIKKVSSRKSSRRAHSLYKDSKEMDFIGRVPNYNAINKFLNMEFLTPILQELLVATVQPLKSIDNIFAVDSTGFRVTGFNEYMRSKYRDAKLIHKYLKAHAVVGVKTNAFFDVEITNESGADSPQFSILVNRLHQNGFEIKEILADKAYSSKNNLELVNSIGAMPYIPFKSNVNPKARGSPMWKKVYHLFELKREEFDMHYHLRSNAEAAFSAIKRKFGEDLKSKKMVSQRNELLCKMISYNISVVVRFMYLLKVEPKFTFDNSETV